MVRRWGHRPYSKAKDPRHKNHAGATNASRKGRSKQRPYDFVSVDAISGQRRVSLFRNSAAFIRTLKKPQSYKTTLRYFYFALRR